jgi:hypothetical protein
MRPLPNKSGPISFSEALLDNRDIGNNVKVDTKIINSANSIDINLVFEKFKVKIDYSNKCKCPFKFHKNGNERTPSFGLIRNTNNFYCFGCKSAGGPVNFVSLMSDLSKLEAANFILKHFKENVKLDVSFDFDSFKERMNLFIEFSSMIRQFIFSNLGDKDSVTYAENVSLIFDELNAKHNLNIDGLRLIINKLKIKLSEYNGSNINNT